MLYNQTCRPVTHPVDALGVLPDGEAVSHCTCVVFEKFSVFFSARWGPVNKISVLVLRGGFSFFKNEKFMCLPKLAANYALIFCTFHKHCAFSGETLCIFQ